MTEMVYGTVVPQAGEAVLPRWWRTIDKPTFLAVFGLFAIGLLLGLAASPPLAERNNVEPFHYVVRQAQFGGLALTVMVILSMCSPKNIRRIGVALCLFAFAAVLMLPVFGTDFGKGATRWYSLGFASLQPSEFLKPGFVVLSAWLISASHDIYGPPGRTISFVLTGIVVFVLSMQPDFGQAALIGFSWIVMYFIGGASFVLVMGFFGIVALGGMFAYSSSEHFARRIDGYLSPDVDPRTQLGYATDAIREGGFFGVGVGEGSVKWSLPDAHTDFIIAVAAEEYGLMLVLLILVLYGTIAWRCLFRLMAERDIFIRLAGGGLTLLFTAQALINMGVAVRLLPAKGMTLPLISYGGSSLIASGIVLGFLLALTRTRPRGEFADMIGARRGR